MLPSIHIFGFHLPMYTAMLVLGIALFLFLYFRAYRTEYKADRVTFHRMTFAALLSIAALGLFAFLFNSLFHSIEEDFKRGLNQLCRQDGQTPVGHGVRVHFFGNAALGENHAKGRVCHLAKAAAAKKAANPTKAVGHRHPGNE